MPVGRNECTKINEFKMQTKKYKQRNTTFKIVIRLTLLAIDLKLGPIQSTAPVYPKLYSLL